MTRIVTIALVGSLAYSVAAPARGESEKLMQCHYAAAALTTCSGLMGENAFPYTDDKICDQRQAGYAILAYASGMHKYAVEIRRDGSAKPVYRLGRGGYRRASYSFELDGALHVVGNDMMLVIRHAKNTVIEVWRRGPCKAVPIDTEVLERNAAKAGAGH